MVIYHNNIKTNLKGDLPAHTHDTYWKAKRQDFDHYTGDKNIVITIMNT